jgi:hypothetical protein
MVHRFERNRSEPSVHTVLSISGDRWSVTLQDRKCTDFKTLRAGHNPYRGFSKRTCGGSRRIVGRKEV